MITISEPYILAIDPPPPAPRNHVLDTNSPLTLGGLFVVPSSTCQVRHVAVANENAFGVTKFCEHAIWDDLPKITSVQTQYNLLTQSRVERGELYRESGDEVDQYVFLRQ